MGRDSLLNLRDHSKPCKHKMTEPHMDYRIGVGNWCPGGVVMFEMCDTCGGSGIDQAKLAVGSHPCDPCPDCVEGIRGVNGWQLEWLCKRPIEPLTRQCVSSRPHVRLDCGWRPVGEVLEGQ